MPIHTEKSGFSILCDLKGKITEVLLDELHLDKQICPGETFISLFNEQSINKAKLFLNTLNYQKLAQNWELNINFADKIITLDFSGICIENQLVITGVTSNLYVEEFYTKLAKINPQAIEFFKTVYTNKQIENEKILERDKLLYDELSRVNNELANTQRELAKKNIELKRLNDDKNRFLGIASHDLMTPLSTIRTYAEFLSDEDLTFDERTKFIDIINSSSNFMINLINNLLDISKIESGKLELEITRTNIVDLIRKNIEINGILANKKKINLNLNCEKNIIEIDIDSDKIEQVLNNLISNAIKYSYTETSVEISVKHEKDNLVISIKDQGQGIPENEHNKLFKPFQKTSIKSTAGEKSTGLGLAIVKKIIDEHKGKIWVESEINQGTTFFILLPIKD